MRLAALAFALAGWLALGGTAPRAEIAASTLFDTIRAAYDRIHADYPGAVDDWKLAEGAVAAMASIPALQASGVVVARIRDGLAAAQRVKPDERGKPLDLIQSAFDQARAEVRDDRLVAQVAIDGMLRSVDTQSNFVSPSQLGIPSAQQLGGTGLELRKDGADVTIVSVIEGGPAEKAGLVAGDVIRRIDETALADLSLEQVVGRLRGLVGTTTMLEIQRAGRGRSLYVGITRAVIRIVTVSHRAEGDVGYIRITSFSPLTAARLRTAIGKLQAEIPDDRLKGYVVDLRGNTGGLLDETVSIAGMFLSGGDIGMTRGRNEAEIQRFKAEGKDATNGKPIVLLINGTTGSGAEIVAAALQHHRRARLVGTPTAGAGTIQTIIPLGDKNGALRLTTGRFYKADGQALDKNGVQPDVTVEAPPAGSPARPNPDPSQDVQLQRALAVLRQ